MSSKSGGPNGDSAEKQESTVTATPFPLKWVFIQVGGSIVLLLGMYFSNYISLDYGIVRYGFTPTATFCLSDFGHDPISSRPPDTTLSTKSLIVFAESAPVAQRTFNLTFHDLVYAFKCSQDSLRPAGSPFEFAYSVTNLASPGLACVSFLLSKGAVPRVDPSILEANTLKFGEKAGLGYIVRKNSPLVFLLLNVAVFVVLVLSWRARH